jgi:hypothetical protein
LFTKPSREEDEQEWGRFLNVKKIQKKIHKEGGSGWMSGELSLSSPVAS